MSLPTDLLFEVIPLKVCFFLYDVALCYFGVLITDNVVKFIESYKTDSVLTLIA